MSDMQIGELSSVPADYDRSQLKSRKYKAHDYNVDKRLADGPMHNRKCTDVCCCMVFIVFLIGMSGMAIYGYTNGQINALMAPVNGDGQLCGITAEVKDYPILFASNINQAFTNPSDIWLSGVCAKTCPAANTDTVDCLNTAYSTKNGGCAANVYGGYNFFSYCVPLKSGLNPTQQAKYDETAAQFENSLGGSWIIDLYKSRWIITASIGICLVITLIYIKFMDWFAVYLAWISVLLIQAGLILIGILCYQEKAEEQAKTPAPDTTGLWWIMFAAFFSAGLYYIFLVCCFKQLRVSIAIIETAADWFADTKRIIFVPIGYFCLAILVFAAWTCGIAMVSSLSEDPITAQTGDPLLNGTPTYSQWKNLNWAPATYYMIYTMSFGIIWLMAFIVCANEFVTIVATCTWYFSRKDIPDSDGIPGDSEVYKGYLWSIRYHFGSLAFGSCVLTIVWIIHALMEYIGGKIEDATAGNGCTKCLLGCIRCCMDCFDRFMRHLTQNAYIYLALSNSSFCESALNAFLLILKNSVKFAMVDGIAHIFMFIGKCCISITTTSLAYLLIKPMLPTGVTLSSPVIPIIVIFMISYLIAAIFIGIFDAGANTILQCYLMDIDICRQTGQVESHHIPDTLRRFFKSYNLECGATDHHQSVGGSDQAPLLNQQPNADIAPSADGLYNNNAMC